MPLIKEGDVIKFKPKPLGIPKYTGNKAEVVDLADRRTEKNKQSVLQKIRTGQYNGTAIGVHEDVYQTIFGKSPEGMNEWYFGIGFCPETLEEWTDERIVKFVGSYRDGVKIAKELAEFWKADSIFILVDEGTAAAHISPPNDNVLDGTKGLEAALKAVRQILKNQNAKEQAKIQDIAKSYSDYTVTNDVSIGDMVKTRLGSFKITEDE